MDKILAWITLILLCVLVRMQGNEIDGMTTKREKARYIFGVITCLLGIIVCYLYATSGYITACG